MDTVSRLDVQSVWDEIVLHRRIDLNDVPPLATHIQVVKSATLNSCQHIHPRTQNHNMAPVLEGSSKLGGVDGKTKRLVGCGANVHIGVLFNRGAPANCTVDMREYRRERDNYITYLINNLLN